MIRYSLGSALAASLLLIPAAPAQSQEGTEFQLEEIVVTARKREENLQEVPVAISVFTGDVLLERGILSTRDLYANTPGLNYDTGFDQNAGTPAIRGVVSQEIATYRQKVTTFLDGMPILGQQGTAPFLAVRQVEVLRGPQSAAFGRSTFGGAINFITVDPGDELAANVDVDVGSNSLLNFNGLMSGPLGENVGGLIAVLSNQRDGESNWVTAEEGFSLGGESSQSVLAKLLFTPGDTASIELRYKWLETDHEQTPRVFLNLDDPIRVTHPDAVPPGRRCGGGIVPPPEPSCAYVGELKRIDEVYDYNYGATGITDPFVRNQRDRFEADASFDLANGLSLQALGFVSDEYYERQTDANLTNDAFGFERDPTNIEETYGEIRLTSPGDQRLRYGVGLSYYDYYFLTVVYRSLAQFQGGPAAGRQIQESATNTGLFFNLTYDATERTTLSLEGRYQNDDVSGTSIQGDGSTFRLAQKTTAFLPRLSLTYSPADNTTLYVQLAKGNNPAGVNTGALDRDVAAASAAYPNVFDNDAIAFFEEEEVTSYEVGIKGTAANRATYSANLFALDWKGYVQPFNLNFEPGDFIDDDNDGIGDPGTQYEGLDFGPGRSFLQAGDVTGVGLELEGNYFLSEDLSFGLAASLIDITYDEGACSTYPIDFGVPANATTAAGLDCVLVTGNEIRTQPKWSGSFNVQYTRPLANGMEWFARWNSIFRSSQFATEMNLTELSGFSVSDVRVGLSRDAWRAELYINNVFDDDSPQGIGYFFDGRILTPAGTPAPPPFARVPYYTSRRDRAFGARFSYRLGNQ